MQHYVLRITVTHVRDFQYWILSAFFNENLHILLTFYLSQCALMELYEIENGICMRRNMSLVYTHKIYSLRNDQLDTQFLYFIICLLQSSTCFEQRHSHHQEVKFY